MKLPVPARDRFLGGLLRGQSDECRRAVGEADSPAASLVDIYEELFRDGLYAVGDGWAEGRVSVAEEHRATAIVENLMVDLYSRVAAAVPDGRRAVSACVGSELHQVGARMVADVLESEGWRCAFLAGARGEGALTRLVQEEQASLVALSVTMGEHLPDFLREARALRARFPSLTLVAGGRALARDGAQVCAQLDRVTWISDLDGLLAFIRGLPRA